MDPEAFKTPWKIVEDHFGGNTVYLIVDWNQTTIAIVDNWDHAKFIASQINQYFEGL